MSEVALRQLRERCDTLEEENRQLRETLVPPVVFPREWGLRPALNRALACFLSAPTNIRTRSQLRAAACLDEQGSKALDVHMCQLRKKVRPHGIEILTRNCIGYEITPASREVLKKAVGR